MLEQIGPGFIEHGARKIGHPDIERVARDAELIRQKFRRGAALGRFQQDGELLLSLLADYCSGRYRAVPYWTLAIAAFALQYVQKPIDIIPDALPQIGQLDDAVVVSHAVAMTHQELHAYRIWRLATDAASG